MNSISFNLSGKIDPLLVDVIRIIKREADGLGIPFFVVGATARDILLEYCHAIKPQRMTMDLDIGIEVAGWEEFNLLAAVLVSNAGFKATRDTQKFLAGNFEIDIVPFGPIGAEAGTINWPPDNEMVMNVMGFQEAYEAASLVRLSESPPLDVRVPTVPGMAVMKIISWRDKYPERSKDAEDLLFLMEHYAEAGNEDRLYGEDLAVMEAEDFDPVQAGIRLLGRDMAALASPKTIEEIRMILAEETGARDRYRLVEQMMKGRSVLRDSFDELLDKVEKLKQGLNEQIPFTE